MSSPVQAGLGGPALAALGEYGTEHAELIAIAELDAAGRVVHANRRLEQLVGRPLRGMEASELVTPAQRTTLAAMLADPGPGWQQRLLGLFPDARGVPVDYTVSLRRLTTGWLLLAEASQATVAAVNEHLLALADELSRAQRQIGRQNAELARQNERLRELDQLKDVLLANVSHDLRTPLTAILGYAELMRRRGGLPANQARAAQVIERNARRLLRLVNDLLLLAQARAGRLRLELEPVELGALAQDAFELMRPLADRAALELALDADPPTETVVRGDRLRLIQLIENLVSNAVKFTPAGGHVAIAVRSQDDGVVVAVRDDGAGMEPQWQVALFDPFARGPDTGAPGTGLGLAIVRAVADAHGARLELDSAPGRGTEFRVWLPRSGPADAAAPPELSAGPPAPRSAGP